MLQQVAESVLIHQSELLENNTVVVHGRDGVLLVDVGITGAEMTCLANDLRELGQPVVAGFSTHPDWDHLLWHAELGQAPRYGTARCAAFMQDVLSNADWKAGVAESLPPSQPLVAGSARDTHLSSYMGHGTPPTDTFDQQPPAVNGQPGITVGHEDLPAVQS